MTASDEIMPEEWRTVPGYEGLYEVSSVGQVKSVTKNRFLSWYLYKGYPRVCLRKNNKGYVVCVHRIMALAFLGDPGNNFVNHINGVRNDNRIENLEYVTNRENATHGQGAKNKYTGVRLEKKRSLWRSDIIFKGKNIFLGYSRTPEDASVKYYEAMRELGIKNKYTKLSDKALAAIAAFEEGK
jgi:hypothetical protein